MSGPVRKLRHIHRLRDRQQGAVTVMAALFLMVVIAFMLNASLDMSGSNIMDTALQDDSVAALQLAESGIERASWRLVNGAVCDSSLAEGPVSFGNGSFTINDIGAAFTTDFSGVALPASQCHVQVSGSVNSATRTVDAILSTGSGAITAEVSPSPAATGDAETETMSWSHTIASGSDRVLVVGISVPDRDGNKGRVNSVSYGSQSMTKVVSETKAQVNVEIWYLVAPSLGTANIVVTFNDEIEGDDDINGAVGGSVSFTGVDQGNPIDASASQAQTGGSGSSTPYVSITSVTDGAYLLDVVAYEENDDPPSLGTPSRTLNWAPSGGGGGGAGYGPVSPAGSTTLNWSLTSSEKWAMVAVALKPASGGGAVGLIKWREN